ncbi:DUF1289 domain-containing protein [Thalassotalea sp. PLHSN55]|uniref:DUF1289 domain-containing protein n=1 Tax=Thalassotalea sp. PLHSN55 TaxID=3435888 RepID=UPI003F861BF4
MQLEFFDVPSPCIGVCQSDDKGYCMGCFRTRDERQTWINLDSDNKQKVIKRCLARKKRKEQGVKPKVVEPIENIQQPSLLDPQPKIQKDNSDLDFGDFEL